MGTPVVGMAYNGKFDGMFQMLGMPSRLIPLDDFRTGSPIGEIERLTTEALEDPADYRQRARILAEISAARTGELIADRAGVTVTSM